MIVKSVPVCRERVTKICICVARTSDPGAATDILNRLAHTSALKSVRVFAVRVEQSEIQRWLEQLQLEHRDLDEVIVHLIDSRHHDSMRIQRLKKRKLALKDMIAKLESELIPDLDA